jgi:hypothetical protein
MFCCLSGLSNAVNANPGSLLRAISMCEVFVHERCMGSHELIHAIRYFRTDQRSQMCAQN